MKAGSSVRVAQSSPQTRPSRWMGTPRAQSLSSASRIRSTAASPSFFSRREEVIVGAWSSEAARDHILGDELSAELVRVPVVTLREEL